MRPNLVRALIGLLKGRGELTLPRLGRLLWSSHDVVIDPIAQYAAPSGRYATFDGESTTNTLDKESLCYLAEQLGVQEADVPSLVDALISDIQMTISEEGRYEMADLGVFASIGDSIVFIPEDIQWDSPFYGLPVVPARAVHYSEKDKENLFASPLEVHKPSYPLPDEDRGWSLWEAIVALLLSAMILFAMTKCIELLLPLTPELSISMEEKPAGTSNQSNQHNGGHSKEFKVVLPREEGPSREVVRTHYGQPCVIVIASFRSKAYATKQLEVVSNKGYIPYLQEESGWHRVGVQFDCLTEDLYRKLYVLRGEFGEDAWILLHR